MTQVFIKTLGRHTRLSLDEKWSEHVLAAIRDNSWRVLLKPVAHINQKFISKNEGVFTCSFDLVYGETSWIYFKGDYQLAIEHHLELLPRLIRDLSDSSQSLFTSNPHSASWKESAYRAMPILDELDYPELTLETRKLLSSALLQVCNEEVPCETLVHGDFHPGNVMVSGDGLNSSARVIDLENLTFGTVFVDALYCSTWARLLNEPSRYWDLMSYLELKSHRGIRRIDIGLAAALMLNQAHNNSKMTSQRIVMGLFWMVTELINQKRIEE